MIKPNIVLIVMDTARAKNFSCYGYAEQTTPNIDRIAKDAVLYKNVISPAPWTLPSHASLFTGLYPSAHNAHAKHGYLDRGYPTLAEKLVLHGYDTVGFSNNPYVSRGYGLTRGFKEFYLMFITGRRLFTSGSLDIQTFFRNTKYLGTRMYCELAKRLLLEGNPGKNILNALYIIYQKLKATTIIRLFWGDDGAHQTNKRVKQWIGTHKSGRPFFMFINYMECHIPYLPPLKYRKHRMTLWKDFGIRQDPISYNFKEFSLSSTDFKRLESLYCGELRYLDRKVGEIYDYLYKMGILEDSIIIITSDHGENIGEHGLLGHTLSVHENVIRVPLIIRYPVLFPSGMQVEQRVQTHDLFKTLMYVVGETNIDESDTLLPNRVQDIERKVVVSELHGLEVAVNISKAQNRYPNVNVSSYDFGLIAAYMDKHKYIKHLDDENHELYCIDTDPCEVENIEKEFPDIGLMIDQRLSKWISNISYKTDMRSKIKTLKRVLNL